MKSALLCLFLTILCGLRAIQLFLASTSELRATNDHSWFPSSKKVLKQPADNNRLKNDTFVLDNNPNNIFYFVQITDLHLSRYRPKGHTHFFLHFVQSILPVVSPKFVVVTGDLTDAKDKKRITSKQYVDEWRVYQSAIQEKVGAVGWYDVRGNHDCFDLPSWQSRVNYYRTHGYSAGLVEQGKGIYSWQVEQPNSSTYQFVAIDACPKRGPSRPLNFFGYLTSKTMDQLEKALTSQQYNHTFVFSHYPTTAMVFGVSNKGNTFRDLAHHYSAYFCGHLHKLIAGLGEKLQSYDPVTRSLELELGDMKEHGLYRVVAVDHDLISFVDLQLPIDRIPARAPTNALGMVYPMENDRIIWPDPIDPAPSVLVTNPKDSRYSIPSKEPLWRIRQSTHIRFLVFSSVPHDQLAVNISINDQPHPHAATFSGGNANMWTVPWNTSLYDNRKTHILTVTVTQPNGQTGTSKTPFRLDTHKTKINGGSGEFIIKSHMSTTLQFIAMSSVLSMLCFLLVPRFYMQRQDAKDILERLLLRIHTIDQITHKTRYARLKKQILIWSFRLLQLPQDQPVVWHATLFYILSLLCLPWFRADFIPSGETPQERYGTFYIWGIVFGQEWVPIADTWMFAAEQIVLDVLVFLFLVTWRGTDAGDLKCRRFESDHRRQLNERAWFKGLEVMYWLWRISEIIALSSFYGGIWPTLVLNTLTFWMLFVGGTLGWGKNGVFTPKKKKRTRLMPLVPGCTACQEDVYTKPPIEKERPATLTQEEEQKLDSLGTSSGSSSTPFDGSPTVKSRKKSKK